MGKCLMPQVFVIGGGGDEPIGEGDFLVRFLDFDGTILKQKRVDSGGSVTAPDAPDHTDIGLTFDEWTHDTSNVTGDMNVGATYYTTDGKTYMFIRSTVVTGKDVVLYLNKSDGSTLTVDWGDGSANSTFTNTGNFNTGTHTYTNYGDYTIKMWISSGAGTYGLGNSSDTTTVVGGGTQTQRNMLLKAYVGDDVTSIDAYTFYYCYSLTNITIPNSVTSIGSNAFNNCSSLTSVVIPDSVTSIDANVFQSCYSLTNITIPNSVKSIGSNAFNNCRSLINLVIPNSVTSISESAFFACHSLTNLVIQNGVTYIGNYAFRDCVSLKNLVIPDSVKSIGSNAFNGCYSLINLVIQNGVTSIATSAFQDCHSLTNLVIQNGVTYIGNYAFRNCRSTKTYVFERTAGITAIGGTNAFEGINSSTKIYVPDALVATYKSATNWSTYADYIYPISEKGVTHDD